MLRRVALPLLFFISLQVTAQVPLILSVSPESGAVGTEVTITGLNFTTNPASISVWFGSVQAQTLSATLTTLKTKVPPGATYKPISVTIDRLTGFSPKPFIVTSANRTTIAANGFLKW